MEEIPVLTQRFVNRINLIQNQCFCRQTQTRSEQSGVGPLLLEEMQREGTQVKTAGVMLSRG